VDRRRRDSGSGAKGVRRCLAVLLVAAAVAAPGCALTRAAVPDYGIPSCAPGTERDVLASDALQCWFRGRHGWWRVLGHESHLQALVVRVDARDLRDATDIAQRVVAGVGTTAFTEVLVYVRRGALDGMARVSRVAWTPDAGFASIAFVMPADDAALRTRAP